eukprot:Gb_01482 [translate_table: standard]
MEMKASEDLEMGSDITNHIPPLAAALSDFLLSSRCSACFSPTNNPNYMCKGQCRGSVIYCSQHCINLDLQFHVQSGECHLLSLMKNLTPNIWEGPRTFPALGGTCDLRAALRLLLHHQQSGSLSKLQALDANSRLGNLMSNQQLMFNYYTEIANPEGLCHDEDTREMAQQIKEGGKLMLLARQHAGVCIAFGADKKIKDYGQRLEEEALCQVITNGVQVQVDEEIHAQGSGFFQGELQCIALGSAVYGPLFSWCNHSCRPNACYRFVLMRDGSNVKQVNSQAQENLLPENGIYLRPGNEDSSIMCQSKEATGHGPRIVLRTICRVSEGQEISITYTDLIQPKETRQADLWLKYRFVCHCERCDVSPAAYIDHILQETNDVSVVYPSPHSDHDETKGIVWLMDEIECGIAEFVLNSDPDTCSKTLENALEEIMTPKGFVVTENHQQAGQAVFKIHPLHRVCLDAYTALASAYRVLATHMLQCSLNKCLSVSGGFIFSTARPSATASTDNVESIQEDHDSNSHVGCSLNSTIRRHSVKPVSEMSSLSRSTVPPDSQSMAEQKCHCCSCTKAMENSDLKKASELSRVAAAYTLLLAGAVQHFFLAGEWGLIIVAARFWLNAGEALLRWIMTCKCPPPVPKIQPCSFNNFLHSISGSVLRCMICDYPFLNENIGGTPVLQYSNSMCSNNYKVGSGNGHKDPVLLSASVSFLSCMNKFLKLAWPSLRIGHSFLESIQNPIDCSWLAESEGQHARQILVRVGDECIFSSNEECMQSRTSYSGLLESTSIQIKEDDSFISCMTEEKLMAIHCAVHCLCYSKYLLEICYGSDHPLVYYIQNLL